jgi:hypothetical protein
VYSLAWSQPEGCWAKIVDRQLRRTERTERGEKGNGGGGEEGSGGGGTSEDGRETDTDMEADREAAMMTSGSDAHGYPLVVCVTAFTDGPPQISANLATTRLCGRRPSRTRTLRM